MARLSYCCHLRLPVRKQSRKQSAVRLHGAAVPCGHRDLPACRNNSKRRGELAELAFVYKAASLGFGVAKPYGESERFDFIVSSRRRLWRVQVKSCHQSGKGRYGIHAYGNSNQDRQIYTRDEIDFIVVYLVSEDAWYIIPIEAIGRSKAIYLYPHGSRRASCKFEKHREAWSLLESGRRLNP